MRVSDCEGRELAQGTTDAQGIARFENLSPEPRTCQGEDEWRSAYFVSARALNEGVQDMAFTWSDWQRGSRKPLARARRRRKPQPHAFCHPQQGAAHQRACEALRFAQQAQAAEHKAHQPVLVLRRGQRGQRLRARQAGT